jgi:hypothetical protein
LEDDQNSSIASIDCKANNKLHRSPAQAKKQETILEEKLFRQIQRIFFGMKRYQPYFAVKWFRRLNKKNASINGLLLLEYKVRTGCAYHNDE